MSVHIETIDASTAIVQAVLPGATVGDDVLDQAHVAIGDGDTALVIAGSRRDLIEFLARALSCVVQLPEETDV